MHVATSMRQARPGPRCPRIPPPPLRDGAGDDGRNDGQRRDLPRCSRNDGGRGDARARGAVRGSPGVRDDIRNGRLDAPPPAYLEKFLGNGRGDGDSAVPLICLRLLDIISGPICGVYCFTTIVAMVVFMLYRRADYGVAASASRPSRLVGRAEEVTSVARSKGTTAHSVTKRESRRAAPAIRGAPRPHARRSARAAVGLRRGVNDRGPPQAKEKR